MRLSRGEGPVPHSTQGPISRQSVKCEITPCAEQQHVGLLSLFGVARLRHQPTPLSKHRNNLLRDLGVGLMGLLQFWWILGKRESRNRRRRTREPVPPPAFYCRLDYISRRPISRLLTHPAADEHHRGTCCFSPFHQKNGLLEPCQLPCIQSSHLCLLRYVVIIHIYSFFGHAAATTCCTFIRRRLCTHASIHFCC